MGHLFPDGTKGCVGCYDAKPLTEFKKQTSASDGLNPRCRTCCTADQKRYNDKYRTAHGPTYRPNGMDTRLRSEFGIGLSDYEALLSKQDGKCAICRKNETQIYRGFIKRLAVDHCHETKSVRGLLCCRCNVGLGQFLDNPELLEAAAAYLRSKR